MQQDRLAHARCQRESLPSPPVSPYTVGVGTFHRAVVLHPGLVFAQAIWTDMNLDQLRHLFELGGPTMYAIAGLGFTGIAIFVERVLAVRTLLTHVRLLDRRIRDAVVAGNLPAVLSLCSKAPAGLSPVLMRGVEAAIRNAPRDDILAEMSRDGRRLLLRLKRGLGMLATLGSMAPFTGMFGTVLGIMQALKNIGQSGSGGLDVVAGGVSEALVSTAGGLAVALVIVLLHQFLKAQLQNAVLEVQVLVEDAADDLARLPPQALVTAMGNQGRAAGENHGAV